MKATKYTLLFCFVCCINSYGYAQEFVYNVDFTTYFDNREYNTPFEPQTIFDYRLSPEIGIKIVDKQSGSHTLTAGLHYIQPLGAEWQDIRMNPTVYYNYNQSNFSFYMGAFPYKHRFLQLPSLLQDDLLSYRRPNIQGALFQYHSKYGFAEFMCDWYSSQSDIRREQFRLIGNGHLLYNNFIIGGLFQINHKANTALYSEGVCDDIYINLNIGYDASVKTVFDSLSIQASYILGIQRDRTAQTMYVPQGLQLDLHASWRFLGIKSMLYIGENQMPLYQKYGAILNQGDPFFQSTRYSRTDVFAYLIRKPFVKCYFSWNLHYSNISGLQNQQLLVLQFSLEKLDK